MAQKIHAAAAPAQNQGKAGPQGDAGSTKPGTKDEKAAKAKKAPRVYYPGLEPKPVEKDGKPKLTKKGSPILRPTKTLDAVPADFDIKKHKPLGKADFTDGSLWYELKAQELEKKAAKLREEGAQMKALGTATDQKAAKKYLDLQKRMEELSKELEGKGVDLGAIKAKIKAAQEKKAEQAKTEGQPAQSA